jgi:hypothetical protein
MKNWLPRNAAVTYSPSSSYGVVTHTRPGLEHAALGADEESV